MLQSCEWTVLKTVITVSGKLYTSTLTRLPSHDQGASWRLQATGLLFLCCSSFYFKEIKELNKPECIYLCSFLFYLNKGQYREREFSKSASETAYSNICLSYFQCHATSKLRAPSTHLCRLFLCIQVKTGIFSLRSDKLQRDHALFPIVNHISVPPTV